MSIPPLANLIHFRIRKSLPNFWPKYTIYSLIVLDLIPKKTLIFGLIPFLQYYSSEHTLIGQRINNNSNNLKLQSVHRKKQKSPEIEVLGPFLHNGRFKPDQNQLWLEPCIFQRLTSVTRICSEFWLLQCAVYTSAVIGQRTLNHEALLYASQHSPYLLGSKVHCPGTCDVRSFYKPYSEPPVELYLLSRKGKKTQKRQRIAPLLQAFYTHFWWCKCSQ